MNGIVIGGTASGVGKTVTALAVARALSKAGHTPILAKAGPDYIDPSHHAAALGRPSRTLDTWMQGVDGVRDNLHRSTRTLDDDQSTEPVAVIEGMMGLYDGSVTSTAATAAALDVPVALVIDAGAGMQSVGATALGFREYAAHVDLPEDVLDAVENPRVDVAGVIAARAHAGRHARGIEGSLTEGIAWLGHVPPMTGLEVPDRHLGLHMGSEAPIPNETLAEAASTIDGAAIAELASPVPQPTSKTLEGPLSEANATKRSTNHHADDDHTTGDGDDHTTGDGDDHTTGGGHVIDDERPTVAIASDEAFRFRYPATTERLQELATVVTFAPVDGDDLPACDAAYLPGGYPENHAAALSSSPALGTLATRASDGLPILGECGGLMALVDSLTTTDDETYEMAGILPGSVHMCDRYQALDHVELVALDDGVTANVDDRHRGHEFHYSKHAFPDQGTVDVDTDARFAFEMARGEGIDGDHDGLREHRTVGTYSHRHPASGAFDRLAEAAREYATGP